MESSLRDATRASSAPGSTRDPGAPRLRATTAARRRACCAYRRVRVAAAHRRRSAALVSAVPIAARIVVRIRRLAQDRRDAVEAGVRLSAA